MTARPYLAAFGSRFQLMLQYRAAAIAGFATQAWWGGIRVMVFAAFYGSAPAIAAAAPVSLSQAITYTWLGQAFLAMLPWSADPEVGLAVRSGAVGYDRLRPVDTYGFWYARTAGWMLARVAPRAALMFLAAAVVMPLVGLEAWSWRPPADVAAFSLFALSMLLATALGAAVMMLANVVVAATMNERGVNTVILPVVLTFSGSILPLALFPDPVTTALRLQPFAGLVDIPYSIYFGGLAGPAAWAGLGLQAFWTVALIAVGRWALEATMARLQMQGG